MESTDELTPKEGSGVHKRRRLPLNPQRNTFGEDSSVSKTGGDESLINGEDSPPQAAAAPTTALSSLVAPEPKRLFHNPSKPLAEIYDRLDESLAEQRGAAVEVIEARRGLEEAQRRLAEAEEKCRECAHIVRSRTEDMWEGELAEPCHWNEMYSKLVKFREEQGHVDPCPPWSEEGRRHEARRKKKKYKRRKKKGKADGCDDLENEEQTENGNNARKEKEVGENEDGVGDASGGEAEEQDGKEEEAKTSEDKDDNQSYEGNELADLGIWVRNQRDRYKAGMLKPHRARALAALGIKWNYHESNWASRYAELLAFKAEHGHCDVPGKYAPNQKLARWVAEQRGARENFVRGSKKRSQMKPERMRLLEELGFKWMERPRTHTWEDRYRDLCKFRELHGHCNVPRGYEPDPPLGNWVHAQRNRYLGQERGVLKNYGRAALTEEQVEKLVAIGFQWRRLSSRKEKVAKKS